MSATDIINSAFRSFGRVSGRTVLNLAVEMVIRRSVDRLDIHLHGEATLAALGKSPYILVSNHIAPRDTVLEIMTKLPSLFRFNHSLDNFIFQKVVREQTNRELRVIAQSAGWEQYPKSLLRYRRRHIRYALYSGEMEGVGYILVAGKPGVLERSFLGNIERAIKRGEPLLNFPEGNVFEDFDQERPLSATAAHLSRKFGLPIVPAYIRGSYSWRPGQRVDIRFGAAFPPDGMNKKQINARISAEIAALQQMG